MTPRIACIIKTNHVFITILHNLSLNLILSNAKIIMGGHAIDKFKRRD